MRPVQLGGPLKSSFLPEHPTLLLHFRAFLPFQLRLLLWFTLPVLGLLSSCASTRYYKQRTMFQLTTGADGVVDTAKLRRVVNRTSRNYRIQPNDFLSVRVYTNKGEALIDPNGFLQFGTSNGVTPARPVTTGSPSRSNSAGQNGASTDYLVQADGRVRLPVVNEVYVKGLTLLEADSVLKLRYDKYYVESFVRTTVTNNRVIVLGASGGQVIALNNDNMNLLEVLALAGGVDAVGGGGGARYGGRVDNIRIIRGDLKNPRVQFIDLSTLEGMRRGNLQVEPNDIIYVQPIRRPFLEALSDASPVFGLTSVLLSITSFIIYTFR